MYARFSSQFRNWTRKLAKSRLAPCVFHPGSTYCRIGPVSLKAQPERSRLSINPCSSHLPSCSRSLVSECQSCARHSARRNKLLAVVLCHCCYSRSHDIFRIVRKHWCLGHTGHYYYTRCIRPWMMCLRLLRWVLEERCMPVGRPFCSYCSGQSKCSKSAAMSEVLGCRVGDIHVWVVVLFAV